MAYDRGLAARLRDVLAENATVAARNMVEKKMFGGLAFMVGGHMCCGVERHNLMVRVGLDQYDFALQHPHTRPMDFTGKPLRGFDYVAPAGYESDRDLQYWVQLALDYTGSLPSK